MSGATVSDYADLGRRLWQERAPNGRSGYHGLDCPDLVCADVRAAVPVVLDHRRRPRRKSDEARWRQGATRLGITLAEYRAHIEAGEKYCCGCHRWEPRHDFGRSSRARDGRDNVCSRFAAEKTRRSRERRAS